jgi:hypothetical protein
MDVMQREELERLMFFEQTREKAAADYARSPNDPDNLTRWGGALLELAHFRQGQDSIDMVQGWCLFNSKEPIHPSLISN